MGTEHFHCRIQILSCQLAGGDDLNTKLLKRLCVRDGISIATLEKKVGASANSIRRWDRLDPRVSTVKKVADYFDVPIDMLVREDEE